MGRASNRKWAKRVANVLKQGASLMPTAVREATRLRALFGQHPAFRRTDAEVRRQLRRMRQQVAA